MSRHVIALHGILSSGAGLLRVKPHFLKAGYRFTLVPVGWTGVIGTYFVHRRLARSLAAILKGWKQDAPETEFILMGHSWGGALCQKMLAEGAPATKALLINPALDADADFPPEVAVYVFYTPGDPTWAGKFLPLHPFGAMMKKGPRSKGPKIRGNVMAIDMSDLPEEITGHSEAISEELADVMAPRFIRALSMTPPGMLAAERLRRNA